MSKIARKLTNYKIQKVIFVHPVHPSPPVHASHPGVDVGVCWLLGVCVVGGVIVVVTWLP